MNITVRTEFFITIGILHLNLKTNAYIKTDFFILSVVTFRK